MLEQDEVAGHDLIHGELLIGDPGGRRELLEGLPPHAPAFHDASCGGGRVCAGTQAAWPGNRVDRRALARLGSVAGVPLWTADERSSGLARELGVGYRPKRARARD